MKRNWSSILILGSIAILGASLFVSGWVMRNGYWMPQIELCKTIVPGSSIDSVQEKLGKEFQKKELGNGQMEYLYNSDWAAAGSIRVKFNTTSKTVISSQCTEDQ